MSIVRGNCVRETSVKRRNKIVQEIMRNVAIVFSYFIYAIIAIEHGFQCINIHQVPWEVLVVKAVYTTGVFNTSHGDWRMLMHEKPCFIPIILQQKGTENGLNDYFKKYQKKTNW